MAASLQHVPRLARLRNRKTPTIGGCRPHLRRKSSIMHLLSTASGTGKISCFFPAWPIMPAQRQ